MVLSPELHLQHSPWETSDFQAKRERTADLQAADHADREEGISTRPVGQLCQPHPVRTVGFASDKRSGTDVTLSAQKHVAGQVGGSMPSEKNVSLHFLEVK